MIATITAAAEELRRGRLSPLTLLESCLARIDRLEPELHAWVLVDVERVRSEAEARAAELQRGLWRGPLHGIPLGIKDIVDVSDWPTAAGSRRWVQSIARHDATVVQRLRSAGAVLVGKTVTTQYASFDAPPTCNPYRAGRTPGGSSSGSAAALACSMCLGALGSQTGGSITRPASYCGVYGIKPTYGRVSTNGVVPLARSLDHVGTMARCVRDLAILLQAIAGPDPGDPLCADRAVPDLLIGLARPLPAPRLGRVRSLFQELAEPVVRDMMSNLSARLQQHGAVIVDRALPTGFANVLGCHRTIMAVEAADYHEARWRRHPDDYQPKIRQLIEEGLACSAADYARCQSHQKQLSQEMKACFQDVDALLTPATTGPAPDATTTGDPAFNSPWSYTGLPTVSLPAGLSPEGLPLAIQLVGNFWQEPRLLATADWCEEVLAWDHAPPLH